MLSVLSASPGSPTSQSVHVRNLSPRTRTLARAAIPRGDGRHSTQTKATALSPHAATRASEQVRAPAGPPATSKSKSPLAPSSSRERLSLFRRGNLQRQMGKFPVPASQPRHKSAPVQTSAANGSTPLSSKQRDDNLMGRLGQNLLATHGAHSPGASSLHSKNRLTRKGSTGVTQLSPLAPPSHSKARSPRHDFRSKLMSNMMSNPADRSNLLKPIAADSEGGRRLRRSVTDSHGGSAVRRGRAQAGRNGPRARRSKATRKRSVRRVGGSTGQRRTRGGRSAAGHLSVSALAGLLGMPDDFDNDRLFVDI